jgi:hypothetical protein
MSGASVELLKLLLMLLLLTLAAILSPAAAAAEAASAALKLPYVKLPATYRTLPPALLLKLLFLLPLAFPSAAAAAAAAAASPPAAAPAISFMQHAQLFCLLPRAFTCPAVAAVLLPVRHNSQIGPWMGSSIMCCCSACSRHDVQRA